MKTVVLYSGGMDSVAAAELYPGADRVYVRIGAAYEDREIGSLLRRGLLHGVELLDCGDWLGRLGDVMGHVPYRNLVFAVAAAALTGADRVVLGATAGETSGDKSRAFARAAGLAMSRAEGRRVRLAMPFRGITKRQLVARVLRQAPQHGEALLRGCPSCYAPLLPAGCAGCGTCMSCVRRWVAMSLNGIEEQYVQPPHLRPLGSRDDWWTFLRRTPARDWCGVARLNAELLLARQKAVSGWPF